MTTMQQQRPSTIAASSNRRTGIIVGMAVVGLLIGLLGGWLLFGSDDVISVRETTLTDRQNEMVALIEADFTAWQANDVDTVLSYYTDNAVFVALDVEYPVADGSLADYVRSFFGAKNMEQLGPQVVVDGNTVITFHTYSGATYTNIFDFTTTGDVSIVRHEVIR